jgi:hypothetical protein
MGISTIVITQQLTSIAKPYRENISKLVTFYNPNRRDRTIILDEFRFIDNAEIRSIKERLKENKYAHLEVNLTHPYNQEIKITDELKPRRKRKRNAGKSEEKDCRAELIRLSNTGEITHSEKYLRKSSDKAIAKIHRDYNITKMERTNALLVEALIDKFACLMEQIKRRFFCMLRNTHSKLMRIIYLLKLCQNSKFLFFDTFLNRQTNIKSMFNVLSVNYNAKMKRF